MSDAQTQRLLVVANRTECAPHLLEEVEKRAHADATFLLIVPPERDPDAPDGTPDEALELVHGHRHSLPKQIEELGIPTTVIPPDATGWSADHGFPDKWVRIEAGPLT